MSEPRRYRDDEGAEPLARALLGSAARDGLDDDRTEAVARALGLSGMENALVSPPEAPPAPAPSPSAPPGPSSRWPLLGALAVVGAIGVGSALLARGPSSARHVASTAPVVQVAPALPATTATPSAALAVETAPLEAVSVALLPEAPSSAAPPPPRASGVRAPAPVVSDGDELTAELRALERVRAAIAAHRVGEARRGLTAYGRDFPRKMLASEARVLEIETLLAEGRRSEGEALARAFLVASPDSPYAARVRSLLAAAPDAARGPTSGGE